MLSLLTHRAKVESLRLSYSDGPIREREREGDRKSQRRAKGERVLWDREKIRADRNILGKFVLKLTRSICSCTIQSILLLYAVIVSYSFTLCIILKSISVSDKTKNINIEDGFSIITFIIKKQGTIIPVNLIVCILDWELDLFLWFN